MTIEIDDSGWGSERIDAEILTNNGWKYFKDLRKKDEILTLLDDGVIKWTNFSKKINFQFKGCLNRLHNNTIDIVVTDEHHMKVLRRKSKRFDGIEKVIGYRSHYVPLWDLKSNDYIVKSGRWEGRDISKFVLPKIPRVKCDNNIYVDLEIDMKDWVSFFGIWLAEGRVYRDPKGDYRVHISQNPGLKYNQIKELLERLPFGFSEEGHGFLIHNKQLFSYLKRFGKRDQKYIPREILDLPPIYLRELMKWMILGDGNICITHKESKHTDYYTTSRKLKDNFQEILVKLGYSFNTACRKRSRKIRGRKMVAKYPCYEISVRKGQRTHVGSLKWEKIPYEGEVFDLEVPEGRCFYVRRNGKGYFTGNSLVGGTGIGIHRVETGEFFFGVIPLEYFQNLSLFYDKKYLHEAARIVSNGFDKLKVADKKNEKVYVCNGYVLEGVRGWLRKKKYQWNTRKIEGRMQEMVEDAFSDYLISLGVPPSIRGHQESYRKHFYTLLGWVLNDLENRKKLCKTAWNQWSKHTAIQTIKDKEVKTRKDHTCSECGGKIEKGTECIVRSIFIKYGQYPLNLRIHPACRK